MSAYHSPMHIAIVIVSYNSREDLPQCLRSVLDSDDGDIARRIIVVDNASADGSAALVKEQFPEVDVIESPTNTGFAGGNNHGWRIIKQRYPLTEHLVLLNPDTRVKSGWLKPLAAYLQKNEHVACVQPKILLDTNDDPPRINTAGNQSHYLGFGFVTGFNEPDTGQYDAPRAIDFASGAALMVRADILKEHGLFDDDFFLYLEDADLGWKLRMLGYESHVVPQSVVWHRHDPSATLRHYYYLERNRWMLLLSYYKWPTLLLIGPMMDLMELGTLFHAWRVGRFKEKLRVYQAFFLSGVKDGSTMDLLWKKRHRVQRSRCVSDREFASRFAGRIMFGPINRGVLRFIVNPILAAWWAVVKKVMWW